MVFVGSWQDTPVYYIAMDTTSKLLAVLF